MSVIYKFKITNGEPLVVPLGAKFLSIQAQHGDVVSWWVVDENETRTEAVDILCVGTGHPIYFSGQPTDYLGTVQMDGGHLVLHFFREWLSAK